MTFRTKLVQSCCGAVALLAMLCTSGDRALGQGLTYVDANDGFIGTQNIFPSTAINSLTNGADDLWGFREFSADGSIFESNGEDSPEINQILTSSNGVVASTDYDVYAVHWSDTSGNWGVRAGFSSNPGLNPLFNVNGGAAATASSFAGAAAWDVLPPDNPTGTNDDLGVFLEGNRTMYLGFVGSTTSTAAGELTVYLDDNPGGPRTWLDGLAFVEAGTQVTVNATLDRSTGILNIDNPTNTDFNVTSYSITSGAGGLNSTTWTTIGTDSDGDNWTVTAPEAPATFTTALTEAEDAVASVVGTPLAGNGSLNFGAVWNPGPFEDVNVTLNLEDGSALPLNPTYIGTPALLGDFDGGGITLDDYEILVNNMHTDVSDQAFAASYINGNIVPDGNVDFQDFQAFRTAYIDANGLAAWNAIGSSVPEPSTAALALLAGAALAVRRRRKTSETLTTNDDTSESQLMNCAPHRQSRTGLKYLGMLTIACAALLATGSNALAQLFDVNDDDAASPTQAGWTGVDATGINGVTFTPVGDNPVPDPPVAVTIDDRNRRSETVVYGGAEEDMWLDFIFANGSSSEGTGMDVTVAGFTPNTVYNVQLWAFDTSSNADRSATWNRTAYTFNGTDVEPTSLNEYTVTVPALADASGTLLLEGRTNPAASNNNQHNVFLNGFEVQNTIDTLSLEVNTTTGMTKIINSTATSFDLNYYEVISASGSLDDSGWDPLDDTPGGEVVEDGWQAATGSSSILSETNLLGMATVDDTGSTDLALGNAFVGGTEDVQFWYSVPGGNLIPGPVVYVTGSDFLPGDADRDGDVDGDDLISVQSNFGDVAPPSPLPGDADDDDDVDGDDLIAVQSNFGDVAGGLGAATSVPEPASLALLVSSLLLATGARRRK